MTININQAEFDKMRSYIKRECGIALGDEKKYLVESRLTRLLVESGCNSFSDFYRKVSSSRDAKLREQIIDAITTNETYWFRDSTPWIAFQEEVMPELEKLVLRSPAKKIRIWSAAASTGQEAYSTAMIIDDYCRKKRNPKLSPAKFEIVGTDISPSALFIAIAGRYDAISMRRGFVERWAPLKERYFTPKGRVSVLNPEIKSRAKFQRHNLQNSFAKFGKFDVIFLRNVLIYFSEEFKRDILERIALTMNPGAFLFMGSAESVIGYSKRFAPKKHLKQSYIRRSA